MQAHHPPLWDVMEHSIYDYRSECSSVEIFVCPVAQKKTVKTQMNRLLSHFVLRLGWKIILRGSKVSTRKSKGMKVRLKWFPVTQEARVLSPVWTRMLLFAPFVWNRAARSIGQLDDDESHPVSPRLTPLFSMRQDSESHTVTRPLTKCQKQF